MEKSNLSALPSFSLNDAFISGCAGGSAGLAVDGVLFPLDALKTRIQAASSQANYRALIGRAHLYKGFVSAAAASFPCAGVFFLVYDFSKYWLHSHLPILGVSLVQAMSSATAQATQALVRNPFEVVKQNLQAAKFGSAKDAVSQIISKRGLRGLYTGYFSLVMRQIPFSAIQFPLYQFIKRRHLQYLANMRSESVESVKPGFLRHCMNGSIAGGISGFVTTPIDVVKTKLMTRDLSENELGIKEAVKEVINSRGMKGLFSGATMRVGYISLGGAVFFTMYEQMRRALYATGI